MRSVVAILSGFLALMVLGLGFDYMLMSFYPGAYDVDGSTQNQKVLLLTVLFATGNHTLGAYVTAVVAKRAEVRHAIVLGCTILLVAVPTTIARWGHAPLWYHSVLLLSVLPLCYLGGLVRARQMGHPS